MFDSYSVHRVNSLDWAVRLCRTCGCHVVAEQRGERRPQSQYVVGLNELETLVNFLLRLEAG